MTIMARKLPSLIALRAFEAAARHLSFTAAACELNVTQGAISRHIKALELYFGVTLFHRLPRSLELTAEGAAYFPALREALDTIERATRRLLNRNEERILTLSVLPTFAMSWVIPRLAGFNALHPNLEIHMVTSILPVDFSGEIDMAIRVGRRPADGTADHGARIDLVMATDWNGIEAEFLMPDVITPVCSPNLANGRPGLRIPADLRHHTLLHTATRPHAWADWLSAVGVDEVDPAAGPAYGHFFMALQAAARGQGIACVPTIVVADDIAAGRLVAPFQRVESAGSYHLLYRKHEAHSRKIQIFRDWLMSEAEPFRH